MFGVGAAEILIILAIVALLFGPTVVAFFAGYALGQRKAGTPASPAAPESPPAAADAPAAPAAPAAPGAGVESPTQAPTSGGDATESEGPHA